MSKARMIQTLAMTPPYLPEAIELNPSDGNVAYGIEIEDAVALDGFLVLLLAYLNQSVYDAITLYLNGRAVDNTTIAKGEEDDDTPLFIPPAFLEKGHNSLKFGVKRISQNEEFTPEIQVLFHDIHPGGNRSVLNLSISHSIIGKEEADDVLATLRYANMRWWDWIYLSINGTVFEHRLEPDSTNPLPPVPESVNIHILREVLEQVGNNSEAEFKFRVKDRIGNPSRDWSNSVIVDVDLNRRTLLAAVLREIPTENNDDPNEIDLAKMNGGPLWALIHLIETVWAAGDSMVLTFTAELSGSVVATYSETVPVTTLPTQFAWEIPNPKVVPKSQVTVGYQQVRGGAVIGSSKAAVAQVIGEATKLEMDTSDLLLDGFNISIKGSGLPWIETGNDPVGTAARRPVSGGVPPYTFTSSDSSIASVDNQGTVRSVGNGLAIITGSDSAGQSKTYRVTTNNVTTYISNPRLRPAQFDDWVRSVGGISIPHASLIKHLPVLQLKYNANALPPEAWYITHVLSHNAEFAHTDVLVWGYNNQPDSTFWLGPNWGMQLWPRLSICAKNLSPLNTGK